MVAEDGDALRCQVVISGTQEKDFADIPNKGKRFDSDHIFIFHLNSSGKIDQVEIEGNHEDFKKQFTYINITVFKLKKELKIAPNLPKKAALLPGGFFIKNYQVYGIANCIL